jgi:proton-dependent oligopeptide transporter, POT family
MLHIRAAIRLRSSRGANDVKARDPDTVFFGQPRGLAYLAFTEVWERFSFYGMQALLTLYMVHHLLLPGHVENVVGFASFRAILEGALGPMTTLALASQIFGLYAGAVYAAPLLGGWLGDRVLGQRRTVVIGALLMAAGHLTMMSEHLFLLALLLLVIGAGCIKSNMTVQVGSLYGRDDPRRTQAFGIYLIALNVGAFFAPLVCGTLGELYGWHYGFGVAGIGMLVALAIYLSGLKYLPPDRARPARGSVRPAPLSPTEWRAVAGCLLALVPYLTIFVASNQAYNLVIVWGADHVDRSILGWTVPVTWLLTFDGLMTIAGVMLTVPLWRWLSARQRDPDSFAKVAIGGVLNVAAYVVLAASAALPGLAPLGLVLLFFLLMDFSFAWIGPPVQALITRYAPARIATTMVSLLMMSFALSNFGVGWLGRFYEPLGPARFWLLNAAIAAVGTAVALAARPLAMRLLTPSIEDPPAASSIATAT